MNKPTTSLLKFAQQRKSAQQGVVLLEALVAILLFSMGVLALVGLQAAMIKNTTDSKFRAEASYIAQRHVGMMWSDPADIGKFLTPVSAPMDISTFLPNGTLTAVQQAGCLAPFDTANCPYVVTVTWQQPGQAQHTFTTSASISAL